DLEAETWEFCRNAIIARDIVVDEPAVHEQADKDQRTVQLIRKRDACEPRQQPRGHEEVPHNESGDENDQGTTQQWNGPREVLHDRGSQDCQKRSKESDVERHSHREFDCLHGGPPPAFPFDANAFAEDAIRSYPAVDPAAVVAALKAVPADRLDDIQILVAEWTPIAQS